MEYVELGNILSKSEIKACQKFLDKNELDQLKAYLVARREQLAKKGLIPEYFYYVLQHLRNQGKF